MARSLCNPLRVLTAGMPLALWVALAWPAPVLAQSEGAATPEVAAPGDTTESAPESSGHLNINIDLGDDEDVVTIDSNGRSLKHADYVRFGENIHIPKHERVTGDVVALGGSIEIEGAVEGDVVAIGGSVTLKPGAEVEGEVVSMAGVLTLEDSTRVGSDAVSVWGTLKTAPTAIVSGNASEVGFGWEPPTNITLFDGERGFGHRFLTLLARVVWALLLVGLGILAYSIFPTRMARLAETVQERGFVTFLAGMAGWILWLPAFILLCITIVGIPVAILLAVFTPIMALLGYLAVAEITGRRIGAKLVPGSESIAKALLIGVATLEGGLILGKVLGFIGSFLHYLGMFLSVLGWSVVFVAVTMGFGAFLMTRFRAVPGIPDRPGQTLPPVLPARGPRPPVTGQPTDLPPHPADS